MVLQSGEAVRVALPFAPAGPLPKLALDALHQVLPTGLFHLLATKHLLSPGDATRQLVSTCFMSPLCLLVVTAARDCKDQCLVLHRSSVDGRHCFFAVSAIISRWTWYCIEVLVVLQYSNVEPLMT